MKQTTNYKLNKPDYTDIVDIDVFNKDLDTIDAELFKKLNRDEKIETSQINNLDTKLKEIYDNLSTGANIQFNYDASNETLIVKDLNGLTHVGEQGILVINGGGSK